MLHAEVLCFELQRKRIFNPVSNMFTKQMQVNTPMQHLPLLTWGEVCFVGVEKKNIRYICSEKHRAHSCRMCVLLQNTCSVPQQLRACEISSTFKPTFKMQFHTLLHGITAVKLMHVMLSMKLQRLFIFTWHVYLIVCEVHYCP